MVITKFSVGGLQIISAGFIGFAILKIRKSITEGDETEQINLQILLTHLLAFGLYLFSTLTQYVFFANYYLGDRSEQNLYTLYLAIAASNLLAFFEQLCLCNIFWQLSKKPTEPERTTLTRTTRTGSSISVPVV